MDGHRQRGGESVEVRNGSCQREVEPGAGRDGPKRREGAQCSAPRLPLLLYQPSKDQGWRSFPRPLPESEVASGLAYKSAGSSSGLTMAIPTWLRPQSFLGSCVPLLVAEVIILVIL